MRMCDDAHPRLPCASGALVLCPERCPGCGEQCVFDDLHYGPHDCVACLTRQGLRVDRFRDGLGERDCEARCGVCGLPQACRSPMYHPGPHVCHTCMATQPPYFGQVVVPSLTPASHTWRGRHRPAAAGINNGNAGGSALGDSNGSGAYAPPAASQSRSCGQRNL